MAGNSDEWMPHVPAFLEAAGEDAAQVLQGARLALMLAEHGPDSVARVALRDNRVAWCRAFTSGLSCVAIAPRGDLFDADSVPRDTFFAGRWPKSWITPAATRKAQREAQHAAPWAVDGMAWCNHPDGRVHVARVASVDPVALQLQPGAEPVAMSATGTTWRAVAYNVPGWHLEWQEGRHTFHNFRLGAMRAGLRVKHLDSPRKSRKAPETAEQRAARYARWSAACQEGRKRAAERRAAGLEAAREAARQNVQDGS